MTKIDYALILLIIFFIIRNIANILHLIFVENEFGGFSTLGLLLSIIFDILPNLIPLILSIIFITGKDKHLDKTSILLFLIFFIEFIYIVVSQLFHIDFQFGESSLLYFILQIYLLAQYWIVNKHINNKLPKKTIENILYYF